jgi:hypothetical protein
MGKKISDIEFSQSQLEEMQGIIEPGKIIVIGKDDLGDFSFMPAGLVSKSVAAVVGCSRISDQEFIYGIDVIRPDKRNEVDIQPVTMFVSASNYGNSFYIEQHVKPDGNQLTYNDFNAVSGSCTEQLLEDVRNHYNVGTGSVSYYVIEGTEIHSIYQHRAVLYKEKKDKNEIDWKEIENINKQGES